MSDIALSGILNNPVAAGIQGAYAIKVANEWKAVYKAAIAKELAIAQRIQDRANETHRVWSQEIKGCQAEWAAEVCATPVQVPQYDAVQFRVEAESRRQSDRQLRKTLRNVPLNSTGAKCDVTRTFLLASASSTAHMTYAYREAERARVLRLNANRDVLMRQVITQGHGVYAASGDGMNALASMYHQQADSAAGAMNGAYRLLGASARMAMTTAPGFIKQVGNALRSDSDPEIGPQLPQEFGGQGDFVSTDESNLSAGGTSFGGQADPNGSTDESNMVSGPDDGGRSDATPGFYDELDDFF